MDQDILIMGPRLLTPSLKYLNNASEAINRKICGGKFLFVLSSHYPRPREEETEDKIFFLFTKRHDALLHK